jgi:hypothetical protein
MHRRPGMDTILTNFSNDIDVWLSVYISAGAAVGVIGIYHALSSIRENRSERKLKQESLGDVPVGRGEFSFWGELGVYLLSTTAMILLCLTLLSYINARMAGLTGQTIGFPMIREGAFILSGYKGADI